MMPLSVMWSVDRLTDAKGSNRVAEQIVDRWPHDPGSVRFFRSSANFLYLFRHDGKRRFLRFAHSSERRRDAIDAEIALVRWLAGEGLAVVRRVRSRNERFVETVTSGWGMFHAVVFDALEGSQFEIDELDDAGMMSEGKTYLAVRQLANTLQSIVVWDENAKKVSTR